MKKQNLPAVFAGIGLLLLILDTRTAAAGAEAGIEICLKTLIPSLFPFLFLSAFLTAAFTGRRIALLRPVGQLLNIPEGADSILLIGLLGGYPIGAQSVAQAVRSGSLSQENGKRMLAFCSNAGPAFLFGIGSRIFPKLWMCWALWAIHIAAALLVGWLLPPVQQRTAKMEASAAPRPAAALRQALHSMAMICGWVILFRIVIAFCQQWFMWLLPAWVQVLFSGLLELANGCCSLTQIRDISIRFVLCAGLLGFGGLCVTMQTVSVCDGVDISWYLPGKLLQTVCSLLLAAMVISRAMALPALFVLLLLIVSVMILRRRLTKKDSNLQKYAV